MPIQYGPPSLPASKPKPKTVLDPFGVPRANQQPPNYSPGPGYTSTPSAPAQQAPSLAQPVAPAAAPAQSPQSPFGPLDTDPGYLAALAAQQRGMQDIDASLKAAREAAIVQFGDPSLAIPGYQVDPLTASMAQQNTQAGNSSLAQLQKQRDLNQQQIQNQLAAHGIINSGSLGYQTGQNQQAYGTELYNTQQGVLNSLGGLARDALAQQQGLWQNTVGAATTAYDTRIANPAFWGAATVDDGGQNAALHAAAVAPVAQAMTKTPGNMGGAVSRLAAKPPKNPFAMRTARQTVGYG